MRTILVFLAAALLAAACSNDAGPTARSTAPSDAVALRVSRSGLLALALVSDAEARAAALQRVTGGRIIDAELEEEDGRLVYSYDIQVDGERGVVGVEVDAKTGTVLGVEHEDREDDDGAGAREREDDENERGSRP